MSHLENLSNQQITNNLVALCQRERLLTVEVLKYLNEIERRQLHLQEGFSSMFSYCTEKLRYSESAANRRIRAARCLRDYPKVLELLEKGDISLSVLSLVAGRLNESNCSELLNAVTGKSRQEVEAYLARGQEQILVRESIKPIVVRKVATVTQSSDLFANATKSQNIRSGGRSENSSLPEQPKEEVEERFELKFSVSRTTRKKIEKVQTLLSNKLKGKCSLEATLDELLDGFIERNCLQKKAEKKAERRVKSDKPIPSSVSRYIPSELKERVYQRDKGCCTFVGKDNRRCNSTWQLQLDHIKPFAVGGKTEFENLRLVCAGHNRYLARRYFGA